MGPGLPHIETPPDRQGRHLAPEGFLRAWPGFAETLGLVLVDGMDDALAVSWGLWPEKFLLLEHGVVKWASSFKDVGDMQELQELEAAAEQLSKE